jgi:hypothetical protein
LLPNDTLKDLLPKKEFSRADKLLLVLATDSASAKPVKLMRSVAVNYGLREARKWNISAILARADGCAVKTGDGWELNSKGKKRVSDIAGTPAAAPPSAVATSLRVALGKITDANTKAFLDEAIACYEARLYRAAAVLSWVGAASLLYAHVVSKQLPAFNAEAQRRDAKWRAAKTPDGLARMKEHDFLEMMEALAIIGKNVKEELQACLKLRNACGHPSSLKVAENRVAAHIEVLTLNAFSQFS